MFLVKAGAYPSKWYAPALVFLTLLQASLFLNHDCKKFYFGQMLGKPRLFVPCKLIQLSLMFAGKAGVYPSKAPLRCFTIGYAPGL